MDCPYSTDDRKREVARLQRATLANATDHILARKPLNAVFLAVIPFVRDLAAFDARVAAHRIQMAEITGKNQRNPFGKTGLQGLVKATDECLEGIHSLAVRVQPDAEQQLLVAKAMAANYVISDFACPHYTDREVWFDLCLRKARRTFASNNRGPRRKPTKRKKQAEAGSVTKILAVLAVHHRCDNDEPCFDPLGHTALATLAKTSKPSVTRFLKTAFGGYAGYRRLCRARSDALLAKLESLATGGCRERELLTDPVGDDGRFTLNDEDETGPEISSPRKSFPISTLQRERDTQVCGNTRFHAGVHG